MLVRRAGVPGGGGSGGGDKAPSTALNIKRLETFMGKGKKD